MLIYLTHFPWQSSLSTLNTGGHCHIFSHREAVEAAKVQWQNTTVLFVWNLEYNRPSDWTMSLFYCKMSHLGSLGDVFSFHSLSRPVSCLSESSVTHVRLMLPQTAACTNTMLGCPSLELVSHYLSYFSGPTVLQWEETFSSVPFVAVRFHQVLGH